MVNNLKGGPQARLLNWGSMLKYRQCHQSLEKNVLDRQILRD